jgi:conjugative transfer signal peptidase TraF
MIWALRVTLSGLTLCGVAYVEGLRVNHSGSMPRGLWRESAATGIFKAGDVVLVCPPLTDRQKIYFGPGLCSSRTQPMLKPVAAVGGDVVAVTAGGISVNGDPVKNSMPIHVDGSGRLLEAYPAGTYTVTAEQVWLLAPSPYSFDSRYLGPVSTTSIKGRASPVLVW